MSAVSVRLVLARPCLLNASKYHSAVGTVYQSHNNKQLIGRTASRLAQRLYAAIYSLDVHAFG